MKWQSLSCVWFFLTPWTAESLEFSRPEYWSGSLSLLQEIFPTQGLNPGLPHCKETLYQLSHKGSPRILDCVAYPFSRWSSRPRNWTGVACIAGWFFTNWAMREAYLLSNPAQIWWCHLTLNLVYDLIRVLMLVTNLLAALLLVAYPGLWTYLHLTWIYFI